MTTRPLVEPSARWTGDASPPGERYDRHAAEFDDSTALEDLREAFTPLLEAFTALREAFVDDPPGPAVLDAGCGPGRDAEE